MKSLIEFLLSLFKKAKRRKKNSLAKDFNYKHILEREQRAAYASSPMWKMFFNGAPRAKLRRLVLAAKDKRACALLVAQNVLHFQNPDGGWGKTGRYDIEYTEKQLRQIYETPDDLGFFEKAIRVTSDFDNECTWGHIYYLAEFYMNWPDDDIKESIERGLKFIVKSQHENGSWENKNHRHITYNDGVMTGVLGLLLDIVVNKGGYYTFLQGLGEELDLESVYLRGIDCVLRTQLTRANGELGIWAQQHDHETLKPVWARSYEVPAYATSESVGVIKLLQRHLVYYDENAANIGHRIRLAIAFLRQLRLPDGRWARFYDLETEKPIFANRGRKIVHSIEDVEPERRDGYGWFNDAARSLM